MTAADPLPITRRRALAALAAPVIARSDDAFLEDLSRRCFAFFAEMCGPGTGLVLDRGRSDSTRVPHAENIASIAATGFGLTAWCIAAERRWVARADAERRVVDMLRVFADPARGEHGWFYHFIDATTAERAWKCELSSIDTALLLAGVLTCRQYFARHAEIPRLATSIYERIDFGWMRAGSAGVLSHGWKPDSGFLPHWWSRYSEANILYLMAIGSPTHPIPPDTWYHWLRPVERYGVYAYVSGGPLFTHQYSHAWVDFRGLRDAAPSNMDWFKNSVVATRAQRAFCIDMASKFPKSYSANVWGVTASDSRRGYRAWGEPSRPKEIDGTVVPCAAGGSFMFAPELCVPALRAMRDKFGERIWVRYGFVDAFNPTTDWVDTDVLGIDQGITLLSAENLRSGNVWRWFMANPEIRRALDLARFRRTGVSTRGAAAGAGATSKAHRR